MTKDGMFTHKGRQSGFDLQSERVRPEVTFILVFADKETN